MRKASRRTINDRLKADSNGKSFRRLLEFRLEPVRGLQRSTHRAEMGTEEDANAPPARQHKRLLARDGPEETGGALRISFAAPHRIRPRHEKRRRVTDFGPLDTFCPVDDLRVFYDVEQDEVQVLAIVAKSDAEEWLKLVGGSDEDGPAVGSEG